MPTFSFATAAAAQPAGFRNHFDSHSFHIHGATNTLHMIHPDLAMYEAAAMSNTPSPTAMGGGSPSHPPPRRPSRKSTLTQQQKNQKRQRATQDQLITLEMEFNKNPTPTAMVRERIAQEINMTERSVQIWFQNR